MGKIAIVGFGQAGYCAVKAMRYAGYDGEIHVFEKDLCGPANPMLTTYFAGGRLMNRDDMYPYGKTEEIVTSLTITFRGGCCVERLFPATNELLLSNGEKERFDKILIATGAKAIYPRLKGVPGEHAFVMRTVEDAQRIKDYLAAKKIKSALVIGASMVGIKVAELLWNKGIPTTVADAAEHLFPLAALENVAGEIERRVSNRGISFLGKSIADEITPDGVLFSNGRHVRADLICFCIGTRSNIELVANTDILDGVSVKTNRGIVVDNYMQTNCQGIYAAGDCCEGTNLQTGETMIIGLWANACSQGETAGLNMAGVKTQYPGNVLHNITHFLDMDFVGIGDNRLKGDTVTLGSLSAGPYLEAVMAQGKMLCVNMLDLYPISGIVKSQFMKQFTGDTTGFTPEQKGMLLAHQVSAEFIKIIEGGVVHDA